MAIEFPCGQCQQHLSVPDENAGKQAQCPNCNAIVNVPGGSSPNVSAGPTPDNPYSAPVETLGFAGPASSSGELQHQTFEATNCVSVAWRLFNQNVGVLVFAAAVMIAVNMFFGGFSGVVQNAVGDPQSPAAVLLGMLISFIGNLVGAFLTIGMIRIGLAIARREPVDIGVLFSGGPYFIRYFVVTLLFGLAVGVGMLLLIVPGIYIAITYWPAMFLVIDRKVGIFESFEIAGRVASGNRMNSFLLGILAFAINLLGLLMCFVGLLATIPIVYLMGVVAYLSMTGQRFAAE